MTALPETPGHRFWTPDHLLTIDEYAALGETENGFTELVEGRLLMSPSPVPDHNHAAAEMRDQLKPQLPEGYEAILDVDVNLQLAAPDEPGFSRRPDLMVVRKSARLRVREEGGMIRASEVLVVVEVVSPGSKRTDYVSKRGEYADAGIGHYWILDLRPPISVLACSLAEEFGYADSVESSGTFATTEPFAATLDLSGLLET